MLCYCVVFSSVVYVLVVWHFDSLLEVQNVGGLQKCTMSQKCTHFVHPLDATLL